MKQKILLRLVNKNTNCLLEKNISKNDSLIILNSTFFQINERTFENKNNSIYSLTSLGKNMLTVLVEEKKS